MSDWLEFKVNGRTIRVEFTAEEIAECGAGKEFPAYLEERLKRALTGQYPEVRADAHA